MTAFWLRSFAAALIAAPLVLAPALAQDRPGFLDNLFSRGEPPQGEQPRGRPGPRAQQEAADEDDSDLVVRIGKLESRIRQLTGELEQQQFRNQQLERELQQYRGGTAAAAPSPAPVTPPRSATAPSTAPGQIAAPAPMVQPPPAANGRRSDVFDPSQNPNARGAPRALGGGNMPVAAAPPLPAEPEVPVGAPGGRGVGAPLDLSNGQPAAPGSAPPAQVATLPPTQTPKDEYDLAYGYVLRKDYALAEQSLRAFVKKYPDDEHVAEAHYWLGETMFQRRNYQGAADSFLLVVRNYDKSPKTPEALLRLGQSLNGLGQKELACASLGEVERKYPRASASVKKAVAAEQKRASC
ncbi:MAG: tol-pal system protein YbgF [Pseudolabrys sp.]|nr:tol-pal system protein YbgF [Pseudolabrys sp.]MBV9955537.1 tol-pal system protein YbgF [Pseudolabrys sp.]